MRRVLKFYADWCQPCKTLSNELKKVDTDVIIEEIDIDNETNSCIVQHYNIRGIPMMVMLDENVEVKRKSGVMLKPELEKWINGSN